VRHVGSYFIDGAKLKIKPVKVKKVLPSLRIIFLLSQSSEFTDCLSISTPYLWFLSKNEIFILLLG
jgi:hypothetical protein